MRKSILIISMLSAWISALIYDIIEKTAGVEIRVLLYAAIVIMVFGLYAGLKNNKSQKEEAQ